MARIRDLQICCGAIVMVACVSTSLFAQSAAIHKSLTAESEKLKAWAADPVLVDAVKAENARNVPVAEIQKIDDAWKAGKVRRELIANLCADRLRQLAQQGAQYNEVFVTDNRGALVCANAITSDYWQGDETKWIKAFAGGKGAVFVDRPKYDESAKATLGSISLPILDGGKAIGVITVGVVVTEKLAAR